VLARRGTKGEGKKERVKTLYEELRQHCGEPAEQKIKILRTELLSPILTVKTSADLLEEVVPEITGCLPPDVDAEELKNMIKWLAEAADDLRQILDALINDCGDVPAPHIGD
jgi:hypothetical protein